MLDAGTAPRLIEGLTVFSDHADPRVFYVLTEVPRVPADPRPHLDLTLFRGEEAGALLELETTLAPTEEQLDAVTRALSQQGPAPRLARPDYRDGAVELAGWLQADELRPVRVAMGPPSLVGDPSSIVAARLDRHGAAMIEQALRQGDALPTSVIYRLEFLCMRGPLGIDVEADLHAVHDRLALEGALTTPIGSARLSKVWESMATDGTIRVEVLDESGDVEGSRAEAMTRVGEALTSKMLSAIPISASRDDDPDASGKWGLGFQLTSLRETIDATARWSFRERSVGRIVHHAAASLIGVLGDHSVDDHVTFVDLAIERSEIIVRVEPELSELGITALEVELWLGDEPPNEETTPDESDERAAFATLEPEHTEVTIPVRHDPATPRWYRVRARFDPLRTRSADRQTPWQEAVGSSVVLSARRLFPPRSLTVMTGRVELDWLEGIDVEVKAPDPLEPARTVRLDDQTRDARVDFMAPGEGPLTVTARYRGKTDEPSLDEPPRAIEAGDDLLLLDGPFAPSVRVLVVPLPLAGTLSISTELELVHEGWERARSVAWDLPDTDPRTVALRRPRGAEARYRHRTTTIFEDGRMDVSEWVESDDPALVVGAQGDVRVHRVEVYAPGGPQAAGSLTMELVLTAGDDQTSALLEGTQDLAELVLVTPVDAPTPVLTVEEILLTGEMRRGELVDPPEHTVLIGGAPAQ